MTEYEITGTLKGVNFSPATELEEILQNVRTIISTRRGDVPNDRDFGISWDIIDSPINQARAAFSADVVKQLQRYEPRARVIRVDLIESIGGAISGALQPRVIIGVNQ